MNTKSSCGIQFARPGTIVDVALRRTITISTRGPVALDALL